MAKQVIFKFDIGEEVLIKPLQLTGTVMARTDRGDFHDYRIIYWAEGKRNDEWLYDYELGLPTTK